MPTVLITGASGFLGRHIAERFRADGWDVHGLGRSEMRGHEGFSSYTRMCLPHADLEPLIGRLRPEVCIHGAGAANPVLSVDQPQDDFQQGPPVVFGLLDALRRHVPACRFVFLSSAAVYGNPARLPINEADPCAPISPYGFHKWQSETVAREFQVVYGVPTCSLRIFSAYGPGLRRQVIWDMLQKISAGQPVVLRGTGAESRDFIHARDVAAAVRLIADRAPLRGEAYNLADGRETTIRELAALIVRATGRDVPVSFDGHTPAGTPLRWQADVERLCALGFKPEVLLEKGVEEVARWLAESGIK
jgi:UDP-glucose 4-epimerase